MIKTADCTPQEAAVQILEMLEREGKIEPLAR